MPMESLKPNDPQANYAEMMALASTQMIYKLLIAGKNEWNARFKRGELETSLRPVGRIPSKAYLHFIIEDSSCACGIQNLPGTHAEFVCTITKSVVK